MRIFGTYKLCRYVVILILLCCLVACSEETSTSTEQSKVTLSKESTKNGIKVTGTLEVEIQEPTFEAKEEQAEKFVEPAQSTSPLDF